MINTCTSIRTKLLFSHKFSINLTTLESNFIFNKIDIDKLTKFIF